MIVKQGKENNFQVSSNNRSHNTRGKSSMRICIQNALQTQEACIPFYKSMPKLLWKAVFFITLITCCVVVEDHHHEITSTTLALSNINTRKNPTNYNESSLSQKSLQDMA